MMNVELLSRLLSEKGVAAELIHYEITDSTNERARVLARERSERVPTVIVADAQTAGRGRRGRSFYSAEDVGIYVSFLIYPEQRGALATTVTARAAVALRRAVRSVSGLEADIKWVNDLYAGGKKLAGILAESEMASDGKIAALVVGMGINVYKTPYPDEISSIATSIEEQCEMRVSREELVAELARQMLTDIPSEGAIYEEYKSASLLLGERITVHAVGGSYEALALDILTDFSLLIEREDGSRDRVFSGEVSIRPAN